MSCHGSFTAASILFSLLALPSFYPPTMLLKFSKSDILDTSLVHPETGALGFTILTRSHFIQAGEKDSDTESESEATMTRRTSIVDKRGVTVAEIGWDGRRPVEVIIGKEKVAVKEMFGSQSAILS